MSEALVIALAPHLLPLVLSALGIALTPLVALASPKIHELIRTKVTSVRLQTLLIAVADAALANVAAVAQTSVDAAKKEAAEGALPARVAEAAKLAAIEGVKRDLGPKLLAELAKELGGMSALDAAISTRVEAAVATRKVLVAAPSGRPIVAPADSEAALRLPHVQ